MAVIALWFYHKTTADYKMDCRRVYNHYWVKLFTKTFQDTQSKICQNLSFSSTRKSPYKNKIEYSALIRNYTCERKTVFWNKLRSDIWDKVFKNGPSKICGREKRDA